MDTLADRTVAALRSTHDDLAVLVPGLSDDQLSGPSGATEWTVAQVLSHLGSGAEIALAGYTAALAGADAPAQGANQAVWDRWNAMTPKDQAAGFLTHDATLVDRLESAGADERDGLRLPVGFLPEPLSFASVTGMRLNEAAQHSWDVRVATDPAAVLDAGAATVLLDHLAGGLRFMLGFAAKPDQLSEPAVVRLQDSGLAIAIQDRATLVPLASPDAATATFVGEMESAIRLVAGRLRPEHTPVGVEVTGNVTLDDLRRVFPGY